jgi:PAS domain S-box-containing protein
MEREMKSEEVDALHKRWISELEVEYKALFEACPDGVYIYIDDEHKTCSSRMAEMHGISVEHFKEMESFLDECVDPEHIDLAIHTYMKHFGEDCRPVQVDYVARRSDGATFPATLYQVPVSHDGELMVLGFVRPRE